MLVKFDSADAMFDFLCIPAEAPVEMTAAERVAADAASLERRQRMAAKIAEIRKEKAAAGAYKFSMIASAYGTGMVEDTVSVIMFETEAEALEARDRYNHRLALREGPQDIEAAVVPWHPYHMVTQAEIVSRMAR